MNERPSILLDIYCNRRTPYLTVIYLMDKAGDYLLASRHDPLKCGRGEPGMDDSVVSVVTSSLSSPQKGRRKVTGLDDMIKSVVDYCTSGGDNDDKKKADELKDKDLLDEDLPRSDLFELINQHKLHLQFLKENDMCTNEERLDIVNEVKRLFSIINDRSRKNKRKVSN